MPKVHHWFVVRGRAALRTEDSLVLLELDPEGSACCIFSAQDAQEIAAIIADEARTLWETSDKDSLNQAAQVEGDAHRSCSMKMASGALQVTVHGVEPLVAVSFDSGLVCRMDVAQTMALVQILQHMLHALEARAS